MSHRCGLYRGKVVASSGNQLRVVCKTLYGDEPTSWIPGTSSTPPAVGEPVWLSFEAGDDNYPVWIEGTPAAAGGGGTTPTVTTPYFNVKDYGAVGDGTTDDTSAIQSAINAANTAGGGTVLFPAGTYLISSALTIYSKIDFVGMGRLVSTIHQSSTTVDGLKGVDIDSFTMRNMGLQGPGSGTGHGIIITRSTRANSYRIDVDTAYIRSFGGDGINISNAIVSTFSNVISETNGGYGFNLYGVSGGAAGTSCLFSNCYANGNTNNGYHLDTMTYCAFVACAADSNPVGYEVVGANGESQGISFLGCGAESSPTGFEINDGRGIGLMNCWTYACSGKSFWVTGSAQAITLIGCAENSPATGATASFQVDSGCSATIIDPSFTTATSIAAGTGGKVFSDQYFQNSVGVGVAPNGVAGDLSVADVLHVLSGGTIKFGATGDTDLYRSAANALATDGSFEATDMGVGVAPNGTSGDLSVANILHLLSGATIKFGTAGDADLYRIGANSLATDGLFTAYGGLAATGNITVTSVGNGLAVIEGTNAKQGTATLSAGTVTVANSSVTANSRIFLTSQSNTATGALRVSARTAGVSFVITSSNSADTGLVAYQIFEPG